MCSSAVQIRITRVAFLSTGTYFESGEVLKASLISRQKWMKAILFGMSWQQSSVIFSVLYYLIELKFIQNSKIYLSDI